MFDKNAIEQVIMAARRLEQKGFVDAGAGNVSVKSGDYIYITPSGTNKAFLTEEMIAVIDKDMNQVGGTIKASSEMRLHYLLYYKLGKDVGSVVHCHSPYLTAHAITYTPVACYSYSEAIALFDTIEVCPFARPGTDGVALEAIPYFDRNNIVLLGNHGPVSVGRNVIEAMNTMESAEACAKVIAKANAIGEGKRIPQADIDHLQEFHKSLVL